MYVLCALSDLEQTHGNDEYTSILLSDVVVNSLLETLGIQRLQVQHASECKVPNEGGERKGFEKVHKSLLKSKAKPFPPKQSVKFKCQI